MKHEVNQSQADLYVFNFSDTCETLKYDEKFSVEQIVELAKYIELFKVYDSDRFKNSSELISSNPGVKK